jgi:hypothetical protein
MTTKNKNNGTDKVKWAEAKNLYVQLLQSFYERNEKAKTKSFALSLLRLIDTLDPSSKTLPGNEYRALIAEIDGDVDEAIRYREVLVSKIDEYARTHRLKDIAIEPGDYADQLDLLAILYCQSGRLSDAETAIEKSASICQEAGVPFDGKDVLKQIERARKTTTQVAGVKRPIDKRKDKRKKAPNAL